MSGAARVAVYYAPRPDDPLAASGASWLGRDAETNAPVPAPPFPGLAEVTADPRRYGFHATLKPPMRLAPGRDWFALRAAAKALAGSIAPFDLPQLAVAEIGGFLALRETAFCPALQTLADTAVEALDPFRDPAGADELARRRRAGLPPEQDAMLRRWGYPYVFAEWFFHITLTARLGGPDADVWRARAEAHFADSLAASRRVADLCLFAQSAPDRPFGLAERFPLGASA